jgi:hypothetical protein
MSTDVPVPTPLVIPVRCAPREAPCPTPGKLERRKRILIRTVRTVAYKRVAVPEITYGEYESRCDCRTTFRTAHEDVLPKAKYDNKVQDMDSAQGDDSRIGSTSQNGKRARSYSTRPTSSRLKIRWGLARSVVS